MKSNGSAPTTKLSMTPSHMIKQVPLTGATTHSAHQLQSFVPCFAVLRLAALPTTKYLPLSYAVRILLLWRLAVVKKAVCARRSLK